VGVVPEVAQLSLGQVSVKECACINLEIVRQDLQRLLNSVMSMFLRTVTIYVRASFIAITASD
jgi:hypothetical protein